MSGDPTAVLYWWKRATATCLGWIRTNFAVCFLMRRMYANRNRSGRKRGVRLLRFLSGIARAAAYSLDFEKITGQEGCGESDRMPERAVRSTP